MAEPLTRVASTLIPGLQKPKGKETIGIGGSGRPLAPATPPYVRVRIRRFG